MDIAPSASKPATRGLFWLTARRLTSITFFAFLFIGICTMDVFICFGILLLVFPAVIFLQWILTSLAKLLKVPKNIGQVFILSFTIIIGSAIFWKSSVFGSYNSDILRLSLGGKMPAQISHLSTRESSFTDYVVRAYFQCEPDSLRAILENQPFKRTKIVETSEQLQGTFPDFPVVENQADFIAFQRTDMAGRGLCIVYVSKDFTSAYVLYSAD